MFKQIFVVTLSLMAFNSYAICMLQEHALDYDCISIEDVQSNQECAQKYGESFKAYVTSEMCSELLAASLRGEEIETDDYEDDQTKAACLTFEQGQKLNCTVWNYEYAFNFCSSQYGDKYLPHYLDDNCTIEKADELYGYVAADELVKGLEPNIAEAEAILEMLDREDLKKSVGNLISYKPNIDKTFHTQVIDGLLGKLEVIQKELGRRSQLKIKFEKKNVEKFLYMSVRYINLMKRVYKLYAYVAHQNNKSLTSYSFNKLDYLNLKLKKVFALELISKVNFKIRNLSNEMVEFLDSEQNKQIYEYQAMSEPTNKTDYAKLISFLGIRENLNNVWALDRIYPENLLNQYSKTCGPFLSLRRDRLNNTPDGFYVVKENKEYDIFYNDYLARELKFIEATQKISLIDKDKLIEDLKLEYELNPEWAKIMDDTAKALGMTIEEVINNDVSILKYAEDEEWKIFSDYHFRTIYFPGDGVFSKTKMINSLSTAALDRRLKAIKNAYSGTYVWYSDGEQKILLDTITKQIDQNHKWPFKKIFQNELLKILSDYGNVKNLSQINYNDKVQQTLDAAKLGARAGYAAGMIDKGKATKQAFDPVSFEDLTFLFEYKLAQDFQDIKLTLERNEKLALVLSQFFNQVAEKFNSHYLVETMQGMEFKGNYQDRSKALYKALFDVAREYYQKNKFEVTSMAKVPQAVLLAREEERRRLTGNPYMIKVYRDNTPVTVHIDEFYAAFQKDMRIYISKQEIQNPFYPFLGFNSLNQTTTDHDVTTDGSFGQPLFYFAASGPITIPGVNSFIDEQSLKRLYLRSLNSSKSEITTNTNLNKQAAAEQKEAEAKYYKKVKQITTSQKLFARVFELFKIPSGSIANNVRGKFLFTRKEQKALADNYLGMIYGQAPVLRNEIGTDEQVTKTKTFVSGGYGPGQTITYEVTEKVVRPLIHKIGMEAYESATDEINEAKAKSLIAQTFAQAKVNVRNKLQQFCKADFKNYKEDESFKEAFRASKYLRQNLMSPLGTTPEIAKRIQQFDQEIKDEIRSWWKAFVEDTVEPVVMWAGLVALVAAGVMMAISTFGAGAPASVAMIAGYISIFLTIEFYVTFPFTVAMLATRINTQFIEVPGQLKFQESLAHSQIDFGKIADYDLIEADRKSNRKQAMWTIGLMPLDLLYGYQVGSSIKKAAGFTGVKLYKRLTGMQLPKYSAPPKSMRLNRQYRKTVQELGFVKGTKRYVQNSVRNLMMHLPRYQMIDESLIRTGALRIALSKQFQKLGIANKPWVILDELKLISNGSKSRFQSYFTYLNEHGQLVEKIKLSKGLKASEIMQHGIQYSKFGFVVKSMFKAIKEGRFQSYIKNWGAEIDELYRLQAQLVKNQLGKFDGLVQKVEHFQLNVKGGESSIDDLLRYLDDDDLALLAKASRDKGFFAEFFKGRQEGYLREMRKTFKDYDTMIESLSPTLYLYGHMGKDFVGKQYQAFNEIDKDALSRYSFNSESEDIVSFYESVIRQNAFNDDASRILRRDLEDRISKLFMYDAKGRRVYFKR